MIATGKEINVLRRMLWLAVSALMIAAWMLVPQECRAEAKCPWLNVATAAGVLGGDVQMTVTEPVDPGPVKGVGTAMYTDQVRMDRFDVTCEFSRKVDSGLYTLNIVVKTMNDFSKEFASFLTHCETTTALKGIGNEAVQCAMKADGNSSGIQQEQIIARVRDRAFVLTVSRDAKVSTAAVTDGLHDDTRNMAEQVAGSLF
jgi:hypothetical protein